MPTRNQFVTGAAPTTRPDAAAGRSVYARVAKPGLDAALAAALLVVAGIPMLAIALAIRLDAGGPVLFRQERVGKDGRPFVVLKFRTMVADRRVQPRPFAGSDRRRRHKTPADPRVTRVGRWLRRASLDELPQLANVLCGEMSLVGPRPELPSIVAAYEPWQHARHAVRPGMTGWWQVQGRSDLPMHEHTDLDVWYVDNVSFLLDLRILLRTARVCLGRSGAF